MTTQRDLANRLGESAVNIGDKLNGNIRFTIENAFKIAEIFGMTLDELFSTDMTDVFEMEEHLNETRIINAQKKKEMQRMRYEDKVLRDIDRFTLFAEDECPDFSGYFKEDF